MDDNVQDMWSNICLSASCWLIGLVFRAVSFLYRSPKTHLAGTNNLIYTYMQAGFCDLGFQLVPNHGPIWSLYHYTPVRMEWAEGLRCSKVFSLLFCLATLTDINNNLYVCEHVWREPLKIYSFSRNKLALGWVSQMGQGNQKVLRLWFRSFQWICWQQEKYWIFPALSFKLILTKVLCFCLPSVYLPIIILGRLCLRGRASVLLS